jgi:nucleotide-binding universal stress UspA family protein
MDPELVLVAVDATGSAVRAVEAAAALAERYDAGLHALYVLPPEFERPEQLQVATRVAAGMPLAESTALGFSADRLARHPGSVVLDAADELGADVVVLGREDASELLGKAAEYVVGYASQPVLSV